MAGRVAMVASLVLAVAACGRAEDPPDFYVRGVAVHLDTDAPFAREPGFPRRLEEVLQGTLQYWGGGWDALAGRTLTLTSDHEVSCGGIAGASGCYDGALRVSTWERGLGPAACVERTVLVHEVGHAVVGDRLHHDPRWMDMAALGDALAGGDGYSTAGEVPCVVAVSVWRHPLDAP